MFSIYKSVSRELPLEGSGGGVVVVGVPPPLQWKTHNGHQQSHTVKSTYRGTFKVATSRIKALIILNTRNMVKGEYVEYIL